MATWGIFGSLVNKIKIDLGKNDLGIISFASIENFSPYTDYLKFSILLFLPVIATFVLLKVYPIKNKIIVTQLKKTNNIIWAVLASLIVFWSLNKSYIDLGMPLLDLFHEGEILGFLPNFTQLDKPFLNTFFIHGFGLDALPSLLASKLSISGNTIALTRFFYNTFSLISTLGCFWTLWEITGFVHFLKFERKTIWLFAAFLFCFLEQKFFYLDGGRSAIFFLQIALTLRFFRTPQSFPKLGLPITIGFFIPVGFLYTYDRAAYFVLVYGVASAISLGFSKTFFKTWIGGSLVGLAVSSVTILGVIGFDGVSEIAAQISYWSKYGKYMFEIPLPDFNFNSIPYFYWPIFLQSSVLSYLIIQYHYKKIDRDFLKQSSLLLILLAISLAYLRISIDGSHPITSAMGALGSSFLAIYIVLLGCQQYLDCPKTQMTNLQKIWVSILIFSIIISESAFNVFQMSEKLAGLNRSDSEILQPQVIEVVNLLDREIQKQNCFFSANSEAIWYYLFNKQSCSKINNVLYALPAVSQQSIANDITKTQPEIVLLTDSPIVTGRTIANSTPLIYQYLIDRYKPYRRIDEYWFWKRTQKQPKLNLNPTIKAGSIDHLCYDIDKCQPISNLKRWEKMRRNKNVSLIGFARLPKSGKPADAVYLSYGDRNQMVAVHRVNLDGSWSISIPGMALQKGKAIFRVWGYDALNYERFKIGSDLEVKLKD